jgi:hypothetical protein
MSFGTPLNFLPCASEGLCLSVVILRLTEGPQNPVYDDSEYRVRHLDREGGRQGRDDGSPSVQQFSPDRINRDDVWNLLERIDVYRDPEIEARGEEGRWGTRLAVTFTDGRTEEVEVRYPKGCSKFPLSDDDIIRKYDRLTSLVLDREAADNLKNLILDIENCKNVSDLSHLLSGEVRSPFR